MKYEHIFFDLDGTLTDSAPGITNCIIYARQKRGWECGPNSDYLKFIGPPMPQSFCNFWGVSPEEAKAILDDYRERFSTVGLFENEPYPGILELLKTLKEAGKKLYVATTKPTAYSVRICDHFGLSPYFEIVSGCGLDGTRSTKQQVIAYARDEFQVDMSKAVMVGDRYLDAEGAAACGIPCIGVSYGFGGREELEKAGCIAVADNAKELEALLMA